MDSLPFTTTELVLPLGSGLAFGWWPLRALKHGQAECDAKQHVVERGE